MRNFLLPAMVMEIVGALGRGLNQGGGGGGSCLFDFSLIIYPVNWSLVGYCEELSMTMH